MILCSGVHPTASLRGNAVLASGSVQRGAVCTVADEPAVLSFDLVQFSLRFGRPS